MKFGILSARLENDRFCANDSYKKYYRKYFLSPQNQGSRELLVIATYGNEVDLRRSGRVVSVEVDCATEEELLCFVISSCHAGMLPGMR